MLNVEEFAKRRYIMKRFLLVVTLCLLGSSNVWAVQIELAKDCVKTVDGEECTELDPIVPVLPPIDPDDDIPTIDDDTPTAILDKPEKYTDYVDTRSISNEAKTMCESLGYTVTSRALCNNKAFPCPRGNMWKCDETATVGDIKYSSSTVPGNGWLLADGSTYDKTKYPQLASLIGDNFGTSKLPDYRDVYLRAAGTVTIKRPDNTTATVGSTNLYTKISATIRNHTHNYNDYKIVNTSTFKDGIWSAQDDVKKGNSSSSTNISIGKNKTNATEYSSLCLTSIGLYVYIYAGQPAN